MIEKKKGIYKLAYIALFLAVVIGGLSVFFSYRDKIGTSENLSSIRHLESDFKDCHFGDNLRFWYSPVQGVSVVRLDCTYSQFEEVISSLKKTDIRHKYENYSYDFYLDDDDLTPPREGSLEVVTGYGDKTRMKLYYHSDSDEQAGTLYIEIFPDR